jgi:tryptophanyl-tRNA synthetase
LKKDAGEAVISVVEPVRTRYRELMNDRGELARLLRIGNDRARSVAAATLARAHGNIGLLPRV